MNGTKAFFDSNVILYLLSPEPQKAAIAEAVLETGGVVSVQVLNEFADVARRKFRMEWAEIVEVLTTVRRIHSVDPLTTEVHDHGLRLADRFGFRIFDGLILASAIQAGCDTLVSEDMQDGQQIAGVTIRNPFRSEE